MPTIVGHLCKHAPFVDDIVIWDNSGSCPEFDDERVTVVRSGRNVLGWGHKAAAGVARHDLQYLQDDDHLLHNIGELYQAFHIDGLCITAALPEYKLRTEASGPSLLLGWGAFHRRSWLSAVDPWLRTWPHESSLLFREFDRVYTTLHGRLRPILGRIEALRGPDGQQSTTDAAALCLQAEHEACKARAILMARRLRRHSVPQSFVGDLSKADAALLSRLAFDAENILEFGAGGSTQLFLHTLPLELVTIESSEYWKARAVYNIGTATLPQFITPDDVDKLSPRFDLVFNDGLPRYREEFGKRAWRLLRKGGCLVYHDTRRPEDQTNVLRLLADILPEVSLLRVNPAGSNLTIIRKGEPLPYVNWNTVEKKQPWEHGGTEPRPDNWRQIVADRRPELTVDSDEWRSLGDLIR